MEITELEQALKERYDDLNMIYAYAEKSYFYNTQNILPRGIYFVTFKEADGQHDKASMLDRDKVYRLSFGICANSYLKIFGTKPKRPLKGHIVDIGHNFTELNVLTPHPVYAWMNWVCILNPQIEQLASLWQLLDEKYLVIKNKFHKNNMHKIEALK